MLVCVAGYPGFRGFPGESRLAYRQIRRQSLTIVLKIAFGFTLSVSISQIICIIIAIVIFSRTSVNLYKYGVSMKLKPGYVIYAIVVLMINGVFLLKVEINTYLWTMRGINVAFVAELQFADQCTAASG